MRHLDPRAIFLFFVRETPGLYVLGTIVIFGVLLNSGILQSSSTLPLAQNISLTGAVDQVFNWQSIFYWIGFLLLPLLLLAFLLQAWLAYVNYRYQLTDEEFISEKGIINKKKTSIPFDQIENIDLKRDLTHRLLGLSLIEIQTAGQSYEEGEEPEDEAEAVLPGLSSSQAESLRQELVHEAEIH